MAADYTPEEIKLLEDILARGVLLAQPVEWMTQEAERAFGRPVSAKSVASRLRTWKYNREQRWRAMQKEGNGNKCDAFERLEMMYRKAMEQEDIKQAHLLWRDMVTMLNIFEPPTKKRATQGPLPTEPDPVADPNDLSDEALESLVEQEAGSGSIPAKVAEEIVARDHTQ